MSTEENHNSAQNEPDMETPKSPTEPAQTVSEPRKRPRLDLNAALGGQERKRGKSMFGILVGTLNKAKIEDKERNASEAAKKRQLIDQRLQAKLRKETDSVRRAEDAKKDKTAANRKEEDLQLKDSVYKLRRTRLSILANFLITSDDIPLDSSTPPPSKDPLAPVPRSHPPPLYYLPAILTSEQEAFLNQRKAEVREAVDKEWELFRQERSTGITEIQQLRQRVAEEEARRKADKEEQQDEAEMIHDHSVPPQSSTTDAAASQAKDAEMDLDDTSAARPPQEPSKSAPPEGEKKDDSAVPADDDDAVEY